MQRQVELRNVCILAEVEERGKLVHWTTGQEFAILGCALPEIQALHGAERPLLGFV